MSRRKTVDIFAIPSNAIPGEFGFVHPLVVESRRPGYPFKFDFLLPLGPIAHDIALQFERYKKKLRSQKSWDALYFGVQRVFRDIIDRQGPGFSTPLSEFGATEWEIAYKRWVIKEKSNQTLKNQTVDEYVSLGNLFVEHLQKAGTLPFFELPDNPKRGEYGHKPTFANIPSAIDPQDGVPETVLRGGEDAIELWTSLEMLHDLSKPETVVERLRLMLSATRRHHEELIRETWAAFTETKIAIETSHFDCVAFEEEYIRDGKFVRGWRDVFSYRPNLWKYIDWKYGGIISDDHSPEIMSFLYNEVGIDDVRRRFHSTTETVVSFVVIILIETLANVEGGRILTLDDLLNAALPGEMRIRWRKGRAQYATYLSAVPVGDADALEIGSLKQISSVQAFNCLKEMGKRITVLAPPELQKALTLCWRQGGRPGKSVVDVISEQTLSKTWHRLNRSNPVISQFRIKLEQIRGTVALLEFYKSGGNVLYIQYLLRHKNFNTTIRYLQDGSTYQFDVEIIRQVQDIIIVAAIRDRHRLKTVLKLNDGRIDFLLRMARNREFFQYDFTEEAEGPDDAVFEELRAFLQDADIVVAGTPKIAAQYMLVSDYIRKNAPELRHTAAWEKEWQVIYVVCEFIIDRTPSHIKVPARALIEKYEAMLGDAI